MSVRIFDRALLQFFFFFLSQEPSGGGGGVGGGGGGGVGVGGWLGCSPMWRLACLPANSRKLEAPVSVGSAWRFDSSTSSFFSESVLCC